MNQSPMLYDQMSDDAMLNSLFPNHSFVQPLDTLPQPSASGLGQHEYGGVMIAEENGDNLGAVCAHIARTRADIDMQPVTRKRSVTWHAMTHRTQQSVDGVVGSPIYAPPPRSTSPGYEEVLEMVRGWTEAEHQSSEHDAQIEDEQANHGYAS
jgi:hypothetical protein